MRFALSGPRSPKLRSVPWSAASRYSPWPDRIAGRAAWSKAHGAGEALFDGYDRGPLEAALRAWREFLASRVHEGKRLERDALLEFDAAEFARIAASLAGNPGVIGADAPAAVLISIAGELFLTDPQEALRLHYGTVATQVSRVAVAAGCDALVELGCGSGVNLIRALHGGIMVEAFGGDLAPNARHLLNEIASATDLPLRSFPVDLCAPANIDDLSLGNRSWLLLTVHAVEQLEGGASSMVEGILRLRNRPRRVLHLEPIAPQTDRPFDETCRSYAELNHQNRDLFQVLEECRDAGRIRILDVRRRLFGVQAFNPTSLLEWEPI